MEPQTSPEHRVASVPEGRWGILATQPSQKLMRRTDALSVVLNQGLYPHITTSLSMQSVFFLPWVSEGAFIPSVGVQDRGSSG